MKIIQKPELRNVSGYNNAIECATDILTKCDGIISVYQFGGIQSPGISDIDLFAVFEDNVKCERNIIKTLPTEFQYYWTHGIAGLSYSFYQKNSSYTLWHNYKTLWGENISSEQTISEQELIVLKQQIALEFLLKNYIDLNVQKTYGTLKLRPTLQALKGLVYDFEFLGITSGEVHQYFSDLRRYINEWFSQEWYEDKTSEWFLDFLSYYEKVLPGLFSDKEIFIPFKEKYMFSKNIEIKNAKDLKFTHHGISLPVNLFLDQKKFYNLHHRLNNFKFYFPITNKPHSPILNDRYNFMLNMKKYNSQYLPNFMSQTSSFLSNLF